MFLLLNSILFFHLAFVGPLFFFFFFKQTVRASQIVIYYRKLTHYTRACDLFTQFFWMEIGVTVRAPRGASWWSEVNKTDVNHRVDKLISNLSLNRFTSALPYLEGTELENKYLCQQLLGQTQREAVSVCLHLDHGADINTASFGVLDTDSASVCCFRGGLYWGDPCVCVC